MNRWDELLVDFILFDLDGTLTDPSVGIIESVRYALRSEGYGVQEDKNLDWVIGPPLQESFATLAGTTDTSVLKRLVSRYRERFEPVGIYENKLFEDVPGLLTSVRQLGCGIHLATSKPTVYAVKILEHFNIQSYFQGISGSELDGTRSDKAEVIQYVLDTHHLPKERCIMVGDRKHDIMGANKNGMKSIGVTYGYGSREELVQAGATHLCDSVMDIFRVIRS